MEIPKLIPVGKHDWALVDEADYEMLSKRTWYANALHYACTFPLKNDEPGSRLMHRFILNPPEGMGIDHINGNTLDNRHCNLRISTQAQNIANSRKQRLFNSKKGRTVAYSSQFKGVYFRADRDRFSAYIGKPRSQLGCFDTEEEAAITYNAAARILYGKFARLNDVAASEERLAEIGRKLMAEGRLR